MVLGTPDWYLDLILSFFLVIVGSVYYISVWLIFKLNTIIIFFFVLVGFTYFMLLCCYVCYYCGCCNASFPFSTSQKPPMALEGPNHVSFQCLFYRFRWSIEADIFAASASHDFALGQKLGMEFERFSSLRSFIVYRRILVIIIPFVMTIVVMMVIYDKGFLIPVIFISFKLFFFF